MDIHLRQTDPRFIVNQELFRQENLNAEIKRIVNILTKQEYIYFSDTYIDVKIIDILSDPQKFDTFASIDVNIPSFLVHGKVGPMLRENMLYDPSTGPLLRYSETETSEFLEGKGELMNIYDKIKDVNLAHKFHLEIYPVTNGSTCPRNTTFFPIIRKVDGEFELIRCLNYEDEFYLPISASLDTSNSSEYPMIREGHYIFYVILNENEFDQVNNAINNNISSYGDIFSIEGATKDLIPLSSCLSYGVKGLENFSLKINEDWVVGYCIDENCP